MTGVNPATGSSLATATGVDLAAIETENLPPAEFIGLWLAATEAREVFSPASVQRMLFVLYGQLSEQPIAAVIASWITLTLQRELFSSQEVADLLREMGDGLPTAAMSVSPG